MNHPYQAPDPAAEIRGEILHVLLKTVQPRPQTQNLFVAHGLPEEPTLGEWYSWQAWLNVLADVEWLYGGQALHAAGLLVIDERVWPPNLHTLHDGLQALNRAYQLNVRSQNLGQYLIEGKGVREVRVICDTPNPTGFDCGIITGLGRKFKPLTAMRVRVALEEPPADTPPHIKWFNVSW